MAALHEGPPWAGGDAALLPRSPKQRAQAEPRWSSCRPSGQTRTKKTTTKRFKCHDVKICSACLGLRLSKITPLSAGIHGIYMEPLSCAIDSENHREISGFSVVIGHLAEITTNTPCVRAWHACLHASPTHTRVCCLPVTHHVTVCEAMTGHVLYKYPLDGVIKCP